MDFQAKVARLESTTTDGNALERVLAGLKLHPREATQIGQRATAAEQSASGEVEVLVPRGWSFA